MSKTSSHNVPMFEQKNDDGTTAVVDPYDFMGVTMDTSDSDISKAYRKLALKLHPDKQQSKSAVEKERIAKLFHDVKEARAFLLEPEHAESRRRYKLKRASEKLRQQQDAQRERTMSDRRKRMKEQLEQKEQGAMKKKQRVSRVPGSSTNEPQKEDLVDQLRKEGSQARENLALRKARQEHKKEKQKQKVHKATLEDRQVRLKWSRSRLAISPTEHSIADLFSKQFGLVEDVEFIGSKGNMALVTFQHPSSCTPCVDAYLHSEEMRASYIGKRKEREQAKDEKQASLSQRNIQGRSNSSVRHQQLEKETLNERKVRQAAERQALLRQMDMEDKGIAPTIPATNSNEELSATAAAAAIQTARKTTADFPPPFPTLKEKENSHLSLFQLLEKFERSILQSIVRTTVLQTHQLNT
mmetsp:Transcript_27748/g.39013  ORF Transcript_27748/g.39013 Transcript_27748/m.39013 type:complete len:412 (+) Transcript_27748:220-1455(+)